MNEAETMNEIAVHGHVAHGFEPVREEFAAVLAEEQAEPGAQVAAYANGQLVVDLWAGEGVARDSLMGVYSSTKGATYVVVGLLLQDGVLDLDASVAQYWPPFGAKGKSDITLRQLLAHQAGVPGVDGGLSLAELADDRAIAARVADQRPYWAPGTAYGYHAYVIGAVLGEVVREAAGASIQQIYEERVRAPFELELYLGLPEALEPRYVPVRPMLLTPEQQAQLAASWQGPDSISAVGYNLNGDPPVDIVDIANSRAVRAGGQASAGGVGNARGLAGLYAAAIGVLDGRPPLLERTTITTLSKPHTTGMDLVQFKPDRFALGFEAKGIEYPFLGDDAFGHSGAAGSDAFADPRTGVAYGYVRRRFPAGFQAPENARLAAAIVRAAAA